MDARAQKLAIKLKDAETAHALVRAGFDTPAKIKRAKDADLTAIPGIGKARLDKVRARCPRQ